MTELCALTALDDTQLQAINGGFDGTKIGDGFGVALATGGFACMLGGGPSTLLMSVGAALSCGPIGWAIVGTIVIGGLVAGLTMSEAFK